MRPGTSLLPADHLRSMGREGGWRVDEGGRRRRVEEGGGGWHWGWLRARDIRKCLPTDLYTSIVKQIWLRTRYNNKH